MTTNGSVPESNPVADTIDAEVQPQTITADEIALYDRQIRLWGVEAQEKLRTAQVLVVTIKALANEICKNLVLAGIGAVTLLDHESVTEEDLGAQFLIAGEDIGKNRAEVAATRLRKLNPRVAVHVDKDDIGQKAAKYFSSFQVIIATNLDVDTLIRLNELARRANRAFYAADAHGFYGYIFSDLIQHEYVIERDRSNIPTVLKAETGTRSVIDVSTKKNQAGKVIETVTKREVYVPLSQAISASLPPEVRQVRRRFRQVPALLSTLRAFWSFQRQTQRLPLLLFPRSQADSNNDGDGGDSHVDGNDERKAGEASPAATTHEDIQLFTRLATDHHQALDLPLATLTAEIIRTFMQNVRSELVPVTAFLGGQLAQDVINVLGHREQPLQNFLLFDGLTSLGNVYALYRQKPFE